ncbi:hypothetical protein CAEBREN_02232 [Caenorhabditis brenneri]|uniref:Uncharacterized protein n=1 Tax=Caenorhabditis brenneri TaxID=135651 RepID=G0NGF6_CAEBE|nr:hypothetical protein CAEBREN_02232 [Caenorhabditis brenneri]
MSESADKPCDSLALLGDYDSDEKEASPEEKPSSSEPVVQEKPINPENFDDLLVMSGENSLSPKQLDDSSLTLRGLNPPYPTTSEGAHASTKPILLHSLSPGGHCSRMNVEGKIKRFSPLNISSASSDNFSPGSSSDSPPRSSSSTPNKKRNKKTSLAEMQAIRRRIVQLEKELEELTTKKNEKYKQVEELKNKQGELEDKRESLTAELDEMTMVYKKLKAQRLQIQRKIDDSVERETPVTIRDKEMSPLHNGRVPGQLDQQFVGYARLFAALDRDENVSTPPTSLNAPKKNGGEIPKASEQPSTSGKRERKACAFEVRTENADELSGPASKAAKLNDGRKIPPMYNRKTESMLIIKTVNEASTTDDQHFASNSPKETSDATLDVPTDMISQPQ